MLLCVWEKYMEDATYYKNIVYKKNAFEDLKTYVKLNYANKNILLVSTKSIPAEDVTKILNALFCGTEEVSHFISRCNFDKRELCLLSDKIVKNKFSLIIAFGGGKTTDVVKYFSYIHHIPYIVCPTMASSMSYFTNYCINPFDSCKSFYANFPSRVFIQESIIKSATCCSNINGLAFLHSFRSVYIEGAAENIEKQKFILLGLEKLFAKLDCEQLNILLCGEDSNLVLMDLFIDFGFFLSMLNLEDYLLINMFCVYNSITEEQKEYAGKRMLLCAKSIIAVLERYVSLNSVLVLEKCNYVRVAEELEKNQITYQMLKGNYYFNKLDENVYKKRKYLQDREEILKIVASQMLSINKFSSAVKSVFRFGIDVDDDFNKLAKSLCLSSYISDNNYLVNLVTGSGILNALIN